MEPPVPPLSVSRPTGLRRVGGWVVAYPLPFLAIGGLLAGLLVLYPGRAPGYGNDVWLGTLVAVGAPLVYGTVRRVLRREFASDVIASLAIVGAIVLNQPFAGVIIVIMQSGGNALEAYAFGRASASLTELLRRAPRRAWVYRDGRPTEVVSEQVRPGDLLLVRSGDLLPVDGTVERGSAIVDEAAVTGEPLPRHRAVGESLLSGSVNVGGPFDLRALRPAGESQYARIVELVRTAQTKKPAIQRVADRYAAWFTPLTVALALGAALLTRSPTTALAVLVVATPCPLILATPIAVMRAVDRASGRGIVTKSGAAMEELGRAQAVLFDKTGTLTSGQAEVERVVPLGIRPVPQVMDWAAALERHSSHPLARALVRFVGDAPPALRVDQPHEYPGAGLSGSVEGHRVVVGSERLGAEEAGRSLAPEIARLGPSTSGGRLASFILVDGVPLAAVLFTDPPRPEVAGIGDRLRTLGVRYVGLLTGDTPENAREVAARAAIPVAEGNLLPESKVTRVGEIRRRYGSTVMVGDGINDAAALATASVGVAMGAHGTAISAEAADVVLLVDDLRRVEEGIGLGQRMLSIARQGILFGLGSSLVLMGFASFGLIPPALGAALQEVIDVAVIFNALRVS